MSSNWEIFLMTCMLNMSHVYVVFISAVGDFCSKVVNLSVFKYNKISYVNCCF